MDWIEFFKESGLDDERGKEHAKKFEDFFTKAQSVKVWSMESFSPQYIQSSDWIP